MRHHDKEAKSYLSRNEKDYIWEIPARKYLLKPEYIKRGETIVDMGCGPAVLIKNILTKELLKQINYIGIDISKEMLKLAKKNVPLGTFIQDDMQTAKIKQGSADIIISLGALHHSEDKNKTLHNWFKILKEGGYILLREPTKEALGKGEGESPNEEGVDVQSIRRFVKNSNADIVFFVSFWSILFHLANRILIKFGLGSWQKSKTLWNIFLTLDSIFIKVVNCLLPSFQGESIAMVIHKK